MNRLIPTSTSHIIEKLTMICRWAVDETLEIAYGTSRSPGLDLNLKVGSQLSHGEQLDLLDGLPQGMNPSPATVARLSKYGAPATKEDIHVHQFIQDKISEWLTGLISAIAGEEASPEDWAAFLALEKDALGVIVDSVDGTTNARAIRSGFSCNIGLYRSLGSGKFKFLGSVSTNQSRETLIFDARSGSTSMVSPRNSEVALGQATEPDSSQNVPGTYASVAARGDSRAELAAFFDTDTSFGLNPVTYGGVVEYSPALHTFTLGGAPVMISFPLGGLEYLHVPHDQTPYDAFPLAGVIAAGNCTYFQAETLQPVSQIEIEDWLSTVTGPGGSNPRPVKEGLLVRAGARRETTQHLLAEVHKAWRVRQTISAANSDTEGTVA
ncbi:hypothetical protein QCD70_01100 [Agreia sp. PsM10]|uniref:hypothetical protein n=1 Tax=Agreia sp. PsM10 TaxID=3030533 RepID=UPI00263B80A8|nr:hypothetical protein [Agreia sp. PsM10]MDN4638830.1 hypothetical protein [Agreia sp. PsM10]